MVRGMGLFEDRIISPANVERAVRSSSPSRETAALSDWLSGQTNRVERRDTTLESLRPVLTEALRQVAETLGESSERTAHWVADSVSQLQSTLETTLKLRVYLHPEDAATVPALLSPSTMATIRWVPEPELSRGDCILETDTCIHDARLRTRLEGVLDALMQSEASPHE